jgi:site-specific DNA-methyltransferase (adenine-specific)
MPISEVYNEDNMVGMARYPDKYFDLAIVDPIYGELVTQGGYMSNSSSVMAKNKDYHVSLWSQNKTDSSYFKELFKVSKNQIVWGGNYFVEEINKNQSCWIVWDKDNGENHFADCELAWTSFNTAIRKFKFRWQGMLQENMKDKEIRIHPTQKPIQLYKWLLKNYAKHGYKILDTHLGSGSSRIACWDGGFDFVGFELDKEYFDAQEKRFNIHKAQQTLF